jgi:hypothetical protein
MFKKLFRKLFNRNGEERSKKVDENLIKLNKALYPDDNIKVVYEELKYYTIKGIKYNLGDKVICRSNECDPLTVGTIIEFWDNEGKWSSCIPQVKDEDGKVWGIMGTIVHYTDELHEILKPMRPLEQWNYLLPDNVKEMYSYTEEEMDRKEEKYKKLQKNKESLV